VDVFRDHLKKCVSGVFFFYVVYLLSAQCSRLEVEMTWGPVAPRFRVRFFFFFFGVCVVFFSCD